MSASLSFPAPAPPAPGFVIPPRYWRWLGTKRALAVVLWLVALTAGVATTIRAIHWFDNPPHLAAERARADGNGGHAQIDFGGQWLMGRMVATGNGRQLYYRQRQWSVLRAAYPVCDESPLQRAEAPLPRSLRRMARPDETVRHDPENLMHWFMGTDPHEEWRKVGGAIALPLAQPPTGNPLIAVVLEKAAADAITPEVIAKLEEPAVGGPLYPPVHALYYAPLGYIDRPQKAYHIFQVLSAVLIVVSGLGVKLLTRGRVWWSVATLGLLFYPGTRGAMDLGQNPTLTLTILIWGWVLASRGYNLGGGIVWGLLAFKPVWAAAFLIVPVLTRRWRFLLGMCAMGATLCAITVPIVGLESWKHWLQIGKEASDLYKVNDNWVHLSRDLQGIPRRILLDFTKPEDQRDTPLASGLAWGLWGAVFGATVGVYLYRADHTRTTGVGAAFLLLGAWAICYHFMYYDVLLSALAVAALSADPKLYLRTHIFDLKLASAQPQVPTGRELVAPAAPVPPLGARMLGYVNSLPLTILLGLYVVENSLSGLAIQITAAVGYFASQRPDGSDVPAPQIVWDTGIKQPLDTLLLLALWTWCGWRLLRGDERHLHQPESEPEPPQ